MRSISVNLYKYDELPTKKAKEVARNWWKNLEESDPAFRLEHDKSYYAALDFINGYKFFHGVKELQLVVIEMKSKGDSLWTGYHDDLTAIEGIVEACEKYDDIESIVRYVKNYMSADYEKQLEFSLEDKNVEEVLIANEYEFTTDGSIYY